MSEFDKVFAGSIPEIYDTYLVPLIFEGFAEDFSQRVARLAPNTLLETAAGSGAVPRATLPKLSPGSSYVATDLNRAMLDHARDRQGADARITWQQADALHLPFDDASFDAVCCQFGVMFFPDRVRGYREARRVLKPGGHFLFSVWDRIEENVFANEVHLALTEIFPENPPGFLKRTPHGYHDKLLIRAELETAGFSNIAIETLSEQSRASSPRHPAIAYCQGTPLRSEIEARAADKLQTATDYCAAAIASTHGNGQVTAKIQALVITAIADTE